MNENAPSPRSHLFTVRLWLEEFADGGSEWRGKATHVLSGETHYFREWHSLAAFLQGAAQSPVARAPADNQEIALSDR